MGASAWLHFVPCDDDVNRAFTDLRADVFAKLRSRYSPEPETVQELFERRDVAEEGTHSILDVNRIGSHVGYDEPGVVRGLSDDELMEYFDTLVPTREQFLLEYNNPNTELPPDFRGSGCFATLYTADGAPQELVFWGFSGD